jgi:hypothetical protein
MSEAEAPLPDPKIETGPYRPFANMSKGAFGGSEDYFLERKSERFDGRYKYLEFCSDNALWEAGRNERHHVMERGWPLMARARDRTALHWHGVPR